MTQSQLGPEVDEKLHDLSEVIGNYEVIITGATDQKDKAWEQVYSYFDEFNLTGESARFIAKDGHYLQRQTRDGTTKLDEQKLQALIFDKYPPLRAKAIWNSIVEPRVNSSKLETAVREKRVDQELVNECITVGPGSAPRIRKPWTKEDKTRALILGIVEG